MLGRSWSVASLIVIVANRVDQYGQWLQSGLGVRRTMLIRASAPPSRGLCSPAGLASLNARSRCATLAARLGRDDGPPRGAAVPQRYSGLSWVMTT